MFIKFVSFSENINTSQWHVYFSRAMGDASSAITYFEESAEFLSKFPTEDMEVVAFLHIICKRFSL